MHVITACYRRVGHLSIIRFKSVGVSIRAPDDTLWMSAFALAAASFVEVNKAGSFIEWTVKSVHCERLYDVTTQKRF